MILKKLVRHAFSLLASHVKLNRLFRFDAIKPGHRASLALASIFPFLNFLNFLKKLPSPIFVSDHFCLSSDPSQALILLSPLGHESAEISVIFKAL